MDEAEVGDVKRLLVLVEGEAAGWQREAARSRLERVWQVLRGDDLEGDIEGPGVRALSRWKRGRDAPRRAGSAVAGDRW